MGEVDDIIKEISHFYKKKEKDPEDIKYSLTYDSPSETLEPFYFWILDFLTKIGLKVDKLVDNFASTLGSGHFSELGAKKTQMQEQASRIMATINGVLRSVLNLIYDLKEFKIRLSHYEAANSSDKTKKDAGILALKQIWMDKVDILRGQGSINALSSGNLQFVTLRDAFLIAKSPEEVDKMDLNDRVKRILKPRVQEFFEWKKRSEAELKKRFEIEKAYLKSQVEALKLQTRWAKPYLKYAEKLNQSEKLEKDAALVTAFNTVLLQLTLMAVREADPVELASYTRHYLRPVLPEKFKYIAHKLRKYYNVVIVDFTFTGIPNKVGQHYVFGGKAIIDFKGYGLNEEEIELLKAKLDESDLSSALNLVEGMTEESLNQIKVDLDELLEEKEEKKKDSIFKGLFEIPSLFTFGKKKEDPKERIKRLKEKGVKKDSYAEAFVRNAARAEGIDTAFLVYDVLKKNYGMASIPYGGEKGTIGGVARAPQSAAARFFGFK